MCWKLIMELVKWEREYNLWLFLPILQYMLSLNIVSFKSLIPLDGCCYCWDNGAPHCSRNFFWPNSLLSKNMVIDMSINNRRNFLVFFIAEICFCVVTPPTAEWLFEINLFYCLHFIAQNLNFKEFISLKVVIMECC